MLDRVFAADWIKGFSLYSLGSHKSDVIGVFFADNGSADCLTISKDGSLQSWKCSRSLHEFDSYERGSHLLATEDLEDEESLKNHHAKYPKLDVQFARTGRFSVITDSGSVDVLCADYHGGTKIMVVGLSDGQFHLYELPEFVQIQSLSLDSSRAISSVCINGIGDWIAVGSESLGQLLVWEWQSESYVLKQQSHSSRHVVTSAAFSPDERFVITGGNDSKVKLWEAKTCFCLVTFSEHSSAVTDVLFSQSGKVVLSGSLDGTVRAFDTKRYRNFKTFTAPRPAQFTRIAADNSGDIIAACAVDMFDVFVWSLKTCMMLGEKTSQQNAVLVPP